jgi:probable rRNA maturation factor
MKERKLIIRFSKTRDFDEVNYYFKSVIRKAILKTLEHEKFKFDAELSVTLCDNAYIKKLNKAYRDKDKPTDVLSFPMYENGEFDISECISGAVLGDIVISLERAKEQAKELGNSFLREVAFLTVHSTLHLLGYDHERSKEEDELQCKIQKEIVNSLEI